MPEDIAQERVDRFDMFYQSSTLHEREELDYYIKYVCDSVRRTSHCPHFGVKMAKELIMALIDFWGVYGRRGG